jgi:hypothetical protein
MRRKAVSVVVRFDLTEASALRFAVRSRIEDLERRARITRGMDLDDVSRATALESCATLEAHLRPIEARLSAAIDKACGL